MLSFYFERELVLGFKVVAYLSDAKKGSCASDLGFVPTISDDVMRVSAPPCKLA